MEEMSAHTVYIPHYSVDFNYSKAERFGELEYGFTFDFSGNGTFDHSVKERIRGFMSSFDAEVDFLLVSGSPSMCMYALACAIERNEEPISILRFDRETRGYKEVLFDV